MFVWGFSCQFSPSFSLFSSVLLASRRRPPLFLLRRAAIILAFNFSLIELGTDFDPGYLQQCLFVHKVSRFWFDAAVHVLVFHISLWQILCLLNYNGWRVDLYIMRFVVRTCFLLCWKGTDKLRTVRILINLLRISGEIWLGSYLFYIFDKLWDVALNRAWG